MLKSLGHEIDEAANDRVAVRLMERGGVDLMLAGVDPADADALELLSVHPAQASPGTGPPAVLTARSPNVPRRRCGKARCRSAVPAAGYELRRGNAGPGPTRGRRHRGHRTVSGIRRRRATGATRH